MDTKFDSLLGQMRESDGSGGEINYTINGQEPDESGNFAVTAAGVGAAEDVHAHIIADVTGLQSALDDKSDAEHSHELVGSVAVGGETVSGEITLEASDNILLSASGQEITITGEPYAVTVAASIPDSNTSNTEPVKIFSGTQADWDAFTPESNVRYVVFIHE
jgi:hypothetical protein